MYSLDTVNIESRDQIGNINMLKMSLFHQFAQEK